MKIVLVIGGVIIAIILVTIVGLFIFGQNGTPLGESPSVGNNNQTPNYSSTVTPGGTSTGSPQENNSQTSGQGVILVSSFDGKQITVQNFKKDPTVIALPNNSGDYALAGGLDPSIERSPYSILYVESDQSFSISLWIEPLGQTRVQAEQELLNKLGIDEKTACQLRYQILTPHWVNELYTGKDLGFSFCPGATPL